MKKNQSANILICPLDWGTGHAARVQLIAYELKKRGHNIILAVPASLLRASDYDIYNKIIPLPSASVRYSSRLPLSMALLLQLPLFLFNFLSDRFRLPGIIRRHNIDLLISDNRFGLWTKRVPCIYITHQLRVMMPRALRFASATVSALHRAIASRYDECWVPDMPGEENLSGLLSHKCKKPEQTRYIGILSRFAISDNDGSELSQDNQSPTGDQPSSASQSPAGNQPSSASQSPAGNQPPVPAARYTLALLSGPEPQRSILEKIIIAQRHKLPGQLVIVAGKKDGEEKRESDMLRIPWAESGHLRKLVEQASFIISRSGYSTVMDLVYAGKTALLVPTPGQPEQEYLATHLWDRHGYSTVSQKELAAGNIPVDEGQGEESKDTEWLSEANKMLSEALDMVYLKKNKTEMKD